MDDEACGREWFIGFTVRCHLPAGHEGGCGGPEGDGWGEWHHRKGAGRCPICGDEF